VLAGLEAAGIDLRGTDLVVLAGCDAGQQADSFAALRACFQEAGADAVLATLWQAPEQAALQLPRFFELLGQGKGKAEALALAQREQIAARRKQGNAAHPLMWAALTVTGEADRPGELPAPTVGLPLTAAQIDRELFKALVAGVALFNEKKDYAGCCDVYQNGLLAAKAALDDRPAVLTEIDQGLAKAATVANPIQRAGALRAVIDSVRKSLSTPPK
jgi:hypothetical protein